MAAGSMAKATVHEPVGAKDLWHHPGWQLPAYIQHVANDLREKGHPESRAIEMAVGIIKNWAAGHDGKGHKVSPETQAAAAKALAEWEALKARAAASRGKNLTADATVTVDLTGPHGYRHGWIRVAASDPGVVERATRAVATDGHAMVHGPGMVQAAQKIVERLKAAGHRPRVKRVQVAGTTHLHISRSADLTAEPAVAVDLAFTESLHPRGPKGAANGGKFVAKQGGGGNAGPGNAQQIRDFQRRTGLPVTGKMDAATSAKVQRLTAKKRSGGGGGSSAKAKAKAKAAKLAAAARQHATREATTINGLTDLQRRTYRILHSTPPHGYRWTKDNRLVRTSVETRRILGVLRGRA